MGMLGGRPREVWVITFGFADLIKDSNPADFNQTIVVLILFIDFNLHSFLFTVPKWMFMGRTCDEVLLHLLFPSSANWDQHSKNCTHFSVLCSVC